MADDDRKPSPDPAAVERFMRLFADHRHAIFSYIFALVANEHDAEEVFQDVSVTLWRRCEDFIPGTNFMAWARTVALNQVRNWRRTHARDRLIFSDPIIEQLADDHAAIDDEAADARAALRQCLQKLRETDRDLITRCYATDAPPFNEIAVALDRPPNSVYKALIRIRRALHDCITAVLAGEDRP